MTVFNPKTKQVVVPYTFHDSSGESNLQADFEGIVCVIDLSDLLKD